jgi:PAS domain S-box-containing protein
MTVARQLTLAMVTVALLSSALVGALVDYEMRDVVEPAELSRLQTAMSSEISTLQAYVNSVRADSLTALDGAPSVELLAAHSQGLPLLAADRQRTSDLYSALMSPKPHYLLLRLIAGDREGQELVRVERERAGASLRRVPDLALQRKGDRPYVRAALAQRHSNVYISPIELRQDHGQVTVPHIPVLRAAATHTPPQGAAAPDGLVVLNIDMGPALRRMQESLDPITQSLYLFDRGGSFVIHPEPGRAFGRDLGTGEDVARSFPDHGELLTLTKPWSGETPDHHGKAMRLLAIPFTLADGPELVLLATGISTATATSGVHRAALTAALLAGIVAVLAALLFSRRITRPLAQMTDLAERYPSTQGEPLPIDAAGELGSLARALARMDSQIRDRNELIQQEEQRFRRVFESVPHATLIVDREQRIVLANARAEAVFGYTRAELLGSELNMLIPEALREAHAKYFAEFFDKPAARAMAMGRAIEIRRKDGEQAHVEIGLAPLVTASSGQEVLASIVDVSNRVRSEAALRLSNRELEQFAYVASHDLQEPLRMVANYTELLARRYEGKLDEKADKYIHYAVDGARRMQKLISDLLQYSRVESQGGSFSRVDLNVTVNQVLDGLQVAIAEAQAKIDVKPLPVVVADATQMQQLFQNLLDNAIKFRGDKPPTIVVAANDNSMRSGGGGKDKVRISVQDNGIGVDMQNAHRMFEMFQRGQSRERFAGTGIGLAVSKRVVERHGGKIWIEPTPSGGSTFCFTLDVAAPIRK